MFINKDFSDDCRSLGIETLDTENDDIFEIENYQVTQLRLQGYLRHLRASDIYYTQIIIKCLTRTYASYRELI